MNQEIQANEIVRQLFEACREQPQSIQRIRSLFSRRNTDDDNTAVAEEVQSLTAGSEGPMRRRDSRIAHPPRPSYSQARDENGITLLSVACLYGASLEVIHFLATEHLLHQHSLLHVVDIDNRYIDDDDYSNDINSGTGSRIDNCLQYACFAGANNDVISYLLQFDPKAVEMPDCTGQLALHAACCSPSNTAVSLAVTYSLIRHYPQAVTVVDHKGRTPLHHACSNPGIALPVVQCLVRQHAAAVQIPDENEMLPLHRACWYRAPRDVVDFLVDQYPSALQCPDQDGELPLHLACLATTAKTTATVEDTTLSLLEIISILLKQYPQAILQRNISGYLPLELVSEELPNAAQVLQLLTPSGWTPLHFACAQGCSMRTMTRLLELFPNTSMTPSPTSPLVSSSLSPSLPFSSSVRTETPPLVAADCEAVADCNHPTLLPLLFYACQGPRADLNVVRLLLEYNPQYILETSRQTGDTLLHHACRQGGIRVQIVEYLVQCHPAAVTIKNRHGFIPLDLAVRIHASINNADDDVAAKHASSPPTLDVLYFLVRNYPNHIVLSYS